MIDRHTCSRDHKEILLDSMSSASGDFLNIACGDYNEHSDKCRQLKPLPSGNKLKNILNESNKNNQLNDKLIQYATPVFPIMSLFGSFNGGVNI